MGYLDRKIDHLVSNIYKNYCVGEPRFLNKKAIQSELSKIVMDFMLNSYQESDEAFLQKLISNTNNLTDQLQVPLTIIKQSLGDHYRIDLATQMLSSDLEEFFQISYKTLFRNMKTVIKQKKKLIAFKKKYKIDEVSISTDSSINDQQIEPNLCISEAGSLGEEELEMDLELTI